MYGDWQVGAVSAEEYVRTATRWARAIKMLDPQAKLVSCGMNGWNDWDRVVIDVERLYFLDPATGTAIS